MVLAVDSNKTLWNGSYETDPIADTCIYVVIADRAVKLYIFNRDYLWKFQQTSYSKGRSSPQGELV